MLKIDPDADGATIVLLGSFNPAIFTPDWFVRHELLDEEELRSLELGIVHKAISNFKTEWFSLTVQENRFAIDTAETPFIRIHDLVVSTFHDHLSHTPITAVGINREIHFDVGSIPARNKVGHLLAPKEPWGDWLSSSSDEEKEHAGMRSLTMEQPIIRPGTKARIQAKVEPSNKIEPPGVGIYVHVNNHFPINEDEKNPDALPIMKVLTENFDHSMRRSEMIINQIMSLAL